MALQAVTKKTHLQLVVRAMNSAGVQQAEPTVLTDTTGLIPRFVDWTQEAWIDLQAERKWDWRRETTEISLATGLDFYDVTNNLDADEIVLMNDEYNQEFLLIRALTSVTATPGDVTFASVSGDTIAIVGSATLPLLSKGETIIVADAGTAANNGFYIVDPTGTPTTSSATVTKIASTFNGTFTTPVNDAGSSATTTITHSTDEGDSSTADQVKVRYVHWNEWRGWHERLVTKDAGLPRKFTLDYDDRLVFDRPTDKFYGVDLDYFNQVSEFNGDSDTPTLPAEYQDIIVWSAVERYADWDEAEKQADRAARRKRKIKVKLDRAFLATVRFVPYPLYNDYD